MLRDFLKVEKEDRLVEQQDACSGKANSTDVTEWIIVNKNGDKKAGWRYSINLPPAVPIA